MNINWDDLAADADTGLAGFFGRMQAAAEAGKLRTFVAVFEELTVANEFAISYWTAPDNTFLASLGCADYLRDSLLNPGKGEEE